MNSSKHQYYFQAHINAQRGFYFDAVAEPLSGVFSACSTIIEDPFWNYCFLDDVREIQESELERLQELLPVRGRALSFLLPADHQLMSEDWFRRRYMEFYGDTWMVATREQLRLDGLSPTLELRAIKDSRDIDMACEVFNDAYLAPDEDGVGYSGLPPAYTEAFRLGLTRSKSFGSLHLLGLSDGKPVAIASAYFSGRSVGIYNVAVSREARRCGFGSSISKSIVAEGLSLGIGDFFLQTEPESNVQDMYASIGFEILTRGTIFSPVL